MGGGFAVMAHTFGDDGEWDAFGFGGGCPTVAGHVEGQRDRDSDHFGYAFEIVVDVVASVAVGVSLVGAGIADYRQKIVGGVFRVLVENHLHFLCPFDYKLLAGLAAAVSDVAVFEVCLLQESHVDEAHASEIKTHQEHIAGVVECRSQRQVQCFDFLDDSQRQCSFDSLVNSGIYFSERIANLIQTFG